MHTMCAQERIARASRSATVSQRKARPSRPAAKKDPTAVAFGERVRLELKRRGWSHTELARGIQDLRGLASPPTGPVGQYVAGDRLPMADGLRDLAEVLEVSTDWLLWGDEYPRDRTARTAIGALEDELHSRLLVRLASPDGSSPALPFDSIRDVLPTPNGTLATLVHLAREHVRQTTGRRAADAWALLAAAISGRLSGKYGAGTDEVDELTRARWHAEGMAHVSVNDPTASPGLSSWRAVSAKTGGGHWIAAAALHGAAVWLDEWDGTGGFVGVVPLNHAQEAQHFAEDERMKVVVLPPTKPRSRRDEAEYRAIYERGRSLKSV